MSGGHFDYAQYRLNDIASSIDELIASNGDTSMNEFGDTRGAGYSDETIQRFSEASAALRRAEAMAQRVDWLVSGDDGEESFHSRWGEEVPDQEIRNAERQRERIAELESAICATIEENLHLADGDVCTLKHLKDAISYR